MKNYSREQRAHIAVAESLSKVFSNKITVYDSENVSGDMQWAKTKNGSFRSQDGTIWVDINAQQGVLGALSHELTHMVSLLDESTFKKISEILIDEYADITKTKSVEDYIREYEERLNLGTKAAYEEFVADCMTNMLTDTNAAETIVKLRNTMNEKAQNKFIKLINDTIRTLKSFVKRSNAIEAASITSQLKSLQKISDLWAQGVSNAMTEFEKTENKGKTVDNDVKNSLKGNFTADEMEKNIETVANMKSVADLTGKEFVKGDTDLVTQVYKYFNSIGNKVESKYGTIILNRTGVKSSIAHGIGRNKAIAFKAVPDVLKHGEIIDYTENYKNRGYDTAVFSAPLSINNEPFYMAAVVIVDDKVNDYYLHEVVIKKQNEDETPFKTGTSQKTTPSDASSSIYSLLNKLQNVNEDFLKNSEKLTNKDEKEIGTALYTVNKFAKHIRDLSNAERGYARLDKADIEFWKSQYSINLDKQGEVFVYDENGMELYAGDIDEAIHSQENEIDFIEYSDDFDENDDDYVYEKDYLDDLYKLKDKLEKQKGFIEDIISKYGGKSTLYDIKSKVLSGFKDKIVAYHKFGDDNIRPMYEIGGKQFHGDIVDEAADGFEVDEIKNEISSKNALDEQEKIGIIDAIDILKKYANIENIDISSIVNNEFYNIKNSNALFSEKLTNVVDSDGKKLSEAQAEFFKDSKVRDEDGNLLKVYHGTNSDFTVFNRGEKNGWLGKGIYFAADKSYAKENGKKVVSAYLNVENPFTVTDNTNILTAINEKFPGTDYIEMTKVLADNGYDGIIYDHWDNGKIIVAFEPNQIKLTDNLTPTENEDVRFSDKLDTDYLNLASEPEKNKKELNNLVESAAMEWGAYSTDGKKPVKLYHGTDKFGFTKFDISKSDDRRTIFLTSSPEIASTYSQVSGERKISERTDIDVDKLSMARTVELLNKYPEYSDFEYEYSYTNGNETEKKLNAELNKLNSLVDKLIKKYEGDRTYIPGKITDYSDRLKKIKDLIFDKEQRNKYLSTQLYINLNNTDMFSGNEDFINEVEQDVRLANALEAKGNPKANYVVEKSMGGYSIELLSFDEAKDKLRDSQKHGNYALYAKFDNPLVIDTNGKNWNDIYAILEPSEKTTFKAEYDSKSNALVLSDEKGDFATLTVDGALERVLPSMARAITNRYGKFFAAAVFAQAKDKLKNSSVAEVPVRATGKRNTREIAEFAQEQGYDGVIFKNLTDNGGRNAMVELKTTADIYVSFTPNTIKSADTVTYGDDGKVIPLSERFSADEDIRYSEKNSLNSEEKGIKQQMIDASAELDKMKPVVSFNEMPTFNSKQDVVEWALKKFEKFGDYITREGYGDIVFDRKRITKGLSYLKTYEERVALATVPYVLEKGEPIFSKGNHKSRRYSTITFSAPVIINGNRANVGVVVRENENNYYKTHRVILPDGSQLVFENDIKKGSNTETKGVDGNPDLSSTDITSTNSLSQIPENVNSKFSEKIGKAEYENVIKSLEKDNAALREDVNDLKELVKVQGKVTHGEVFTKTSVEAVAKKLARDFGMRGEKTELVKMLNEYYSSIASSASDSNLNFTDVMENALPIAQYINENIPEINVLDDQAQEILDYLKTSKISLNELQKQEVASAYDSYNNYRKSLFGSTVLSDSGTPLDIVWKDLSERFPSVFDEDTNPNDMPTVLKDAIEAQKSNFSDNNEWYAAERVQEISQAVYDGYWRASTLHSVADKYQTQINRLKSKHMDKMTTLRENRDKRIANIKAKNTQSRKNAIEKRNVTVERHKVKAKWDYMYGLLTSPTKERNIGTKYQKFVRDMLLSIEPDISADGERGDRTRARLQEQIQALKNMSFDGRSDFTDEVVLNMFEKIREPLLQKGFKGLNSTELNEVNKALRATRAVITNEKKLFTEGKEATVADTAKTVTKEVKHISKQKNERITKIAGIDLRGIKRFGLDLLKPEYAFRYLGSDEFLKLFKNAQKGDNTMARDIEESNNFCVDIEKKYKAHKWKFKKKIATVGKLNLTLGEVMSLYAYSRREAADLHLSDGGIATPDSLEKKVKGIKVETERIQTDRVRLDKDTVRALTDKLTKEQKAFVEDMQKYLSETMAAKGNEVSQVIYEIDLFTEENYFPLKVDSEFLAKDMKKEFTKASLKSSGMTHPTIKNANKPIVLENFLDVWANHVAEMSMYHSYVLGIEDLVKVFNYTDYMTNEERSESVKSVISAAYGKEMTDYINKFLIDLNGGVNNNFSSFGGKAFSKFKKTAVAASLSVAIQQPMAIVRAMAYINPQYFVQIPKHLLKTTWTELKKYSGIAVLKEIGGFDIGNGRGQANYLKSNFGKSIGDKFDDATMYLAGKGDEIGWSIIWNAAKAETTKKYPQLKGEALLKKAGERFDEVVSLTQVYDSTFSRSGIMRGNSDFNKMATSFMGEPITSLNMYIDAAVQSNRGKISKMQAARTIGSVILAQVLGAAAKSLIYAGRDDSPDKSYGEKYFEQLGGAIADEINPLNLIPIVRDIWSLLSGNDIERPDMTQISNLFKAIENLNNDNRSTYRKIEDFAGAVASTFGIPVKNIMRDMRAFYNTCIVAPFDDNEFDAENAADLFVEGFFDPWNTIASDVLKRKDLQIGAEATGGTAVAYIDRGKTEKGKEMIDQLVKEKIEEGKTEKQAKAAVRSSFTSAYKQKYIKAYYDKDNDTMLEIRKKLQSTRLYDDVSGTCQEWIKNSKSSEDK